MVHQEKRHRMKSAPLRTIGLAIVTILTLGVLLYTGCDDATRSTSNRSPVILGVETKTECVKPSSSLSISCIASDADGDVLTYTWSATAGMFLGEGQEIFWQVPEVPGEYDIRVEVADGQGGAVDSDLAVNVRDNNPPVIDSLTADPSEVEQGKTATIRCVAADPDGDELIYYWSATSGNISGKGAEATWVAPIICDTNIILVEVVDSCGLAASKKLEIIVSPCSPASTPKVATDDIPDTEEEVPRITVEELWQKMESGADILVIDVRKQAEYETGHIKGAVSGPGEKIYLGEWKPPKGKELILY